MPKKKKNKGKGSKPKLSQAKRSNIKRHKLVKQGKAKPNSQLNYNPSKKSKGKGEIERPKVSTEQQRGTYLLRNKY